MASGWLIIRQLRQLSFCEWIPGKKLGPAKLAKFTAAFREFAFDGSTRHRNFCDHMRKSGPSNYVPNYMIQHGIWAFTKPEAEPLLADFDAEKTWQDLLDSSLKCR